MSVHVCDELALRCHVGSCCVSRPAGVLGLVEDLLSQLGQPSLQSTHCEHVCTGLAVKDKCHAGVQCIWCSDLMAHMLL